MSKNHSHGEPAGETVPGAANSGGGAEKEDLCACPVNEPAAAGQESAPAETDSPAGGPAAENRAKTAAEPFMEDIIADLEAQLAETKDQYLRKAADFENFRKRMIREKQDAIDFANQALLLDLIPVIDDFERAIQSAATSEDFKSLYEGISMIEKRLTSQLESKWGLKRFDSAGEAFDPNRHEALMMEKSAEVSEPVVKEDLLKGYTLKDRVIRSAKVKVVMPETGAADSKEAGD
jgi:molecular chaperone GrpE